MEHEERLTVALADRYQMERSVGSGGMATVFLAHDLRHDRKVAIKVLRPELSAVLGAERFLTEIKVTANLQHPHILPLHDSGEAEGLLFYVMPYVEGESLRDRLQRETQLSIEDAFQITQEVADGLSYAHGLGVIHRDIKPENILLSGGHALIADFGIARAVTEAGGSRLTETGLSLGTPHYMSPEQAAGERDVNARSDEYALGCVLFEMLVGEPPHTGPNSQAIIAKVLTEDAPSARKSRELLNPQADAVIGKALAKLPADRFASIQEFSGALKRAGTGGWEATGGHAGTSSLPAPASWSTKIVWSLLGAFAVLAAGIILWPKSPPTSSLRGMARTTLMPRPADSVSLGVLAPTTLGTEVGTLAISDDGQRVAFVGRISGEDATHLFVRDLEHSGAIRLQGTESAASPFFSPDGEWLGYYSWADRRLKKVPVTGGAPQVICECDPILTADWGPDGTIVMDSDGLGGLRLVDAGAGAPEIAVDLEEHREDPEYTFQHPHFLPDGRHVLFSAWGANGATRRLAMFSFDTGERTTLFQDGWAPRYVDTGHILFLRTDQIWALPFDVGRLEAGATALPVVDSVYAIQFVTLFGVSEEGNLVYTPGPVPE
jgi:serine/threonine-protein kinase